MNGPPVLSGLCDCERCTARTDKTYDRPGTCPTKDPAVSALFEACGPQR